MLPPADPKSNSKYGINAVQPETTPTVASSRPDKSMKIPSVVVADDEKAASVKKVLGSENGKDTHRPTSETADSDRSSHSVSPVPDRTSSLRSR